MSNALAGVDKKIAAYELEKQVEGKRTHAARVEAFRAELLAREIIDRPGTHHEFKSGKHGRKLDFDLIKTGSLLYREWVGVTVDHIKIRFDKLPEIILGVANGTNRLSESVATGLGKNIIGLTTMKEEDAAGKPIYLPKHAREVIGNREPEHVLILEDVGTTGGSAAQAAAAAISAGADHVSVLNTWQRQEQLPALDGLAVPYTAVIDEALATFPPDACDFCNEEWTLIPRS